MNLLRSIFLIFLALKLAGLGVVAAWSWWWVTAPIWGVFAFSFVIVLLSYATLGSPNAYKETDWYKSLGSRRVGKEGT
ncbi:transmembrane Fragile-X-F family protein [Burkholderia multivorans]|uniref:transmembrane Fragile-X-F family protein n=1 Tax=Burkholderia multivorans TaxID=87883 RepID=UPI001E4B855E|nr:transmembrane Fragile-X-F family protein [Burkholderia multivorans]